MSRKLNFCACLLALSMLAGCTSPSSLAEGLATPLPTGFMPTVVALTLQAGSPPATLPVKDTPLAVSPGTGSPIPSTPSESAVEPGPSAPLQPAATLTTTLQPSIPTVITTPTVSPTPTFLPEIPSAHIQIFQLGELSRVSSPIKVSARLFSKVGKVVRVELHGEDGRLLVRELSSLPAIPWSTATVSTEMEFEIRLAAEYGRLVISVEDAFGRLIDVNSVNLVLLQFGDSEPNPATALWQVIEIDEPRPQTLIQGGSVFVSRAGTPPNTLGQRRCFIQPGWPGWRARTSGHRAGLPVVTSIPRRLRHLRCRRALIQSPRSLRL